MSQYIQTPPPPVQHSAPPIRPSRHGLALPTLILGFLGLLVFPLGIVAVILGVMVIMGIKKSGGQKTGKGMAILGMTFAIVGFIFLSLAANRPPTESLPTGKKVTPEATLAVAEANIITSNKGVAYSNSDTGLALAEEFSEMFKEISLESTDSLNEKSEFITHCQLHGDSVAFIVHVPKLRKFNDESKQRFCEAAWVLASFILASNPEVPVGTDLAVAVKGAVLYENMYFGKFQIPVGEEPEGVETISKDKSRLEGFFKGSPESIEETAVEETAEDSGETQQDENNDL